MIQLLPIDLCVIDSTFAKACFQIMKYLQEHKYLVFTEEGEVSEQNYMISFAYLLGCELKDKEHLYGGELKKILSVCHNEKIIALAKRIKRSCNDDIVKAKPDFVIHKCLEREKLHPVHQCFIVETKTSKGLSQDDFSWDIFKLHGYISQLNYKDAVYIIINSDKSIVENKLNKYIDEYVVDLNSWLEEAKKGRLLFFIQKDKDSVPETFQVQITIDSN